VAIRRDSAFQWHKRRRRDPGNQQFACRSKEL